MKARTIALAAALATSLGACDLFYDVIVPSYDITPPLAWAAIYKNETYQQLSTESFVQKVPTLEEYTFIIAAGTDDGGTRKAKLYYSWVSGCTNGELGRIQNGHSTEMVQEQAGGVGSTVKNGAWTGKFIRLGNFVDCPAGYWPTGVTLTWIATAEDFHGNVKTHPGASLQWP